VPARFSSVAALIAQAGVGDQRATDIIDLLDDEARLVVAAQRVPRAERLAWLRAETDAEWSEARLAHVEQRAFVQLRRQVQRRGLWQP
jgi:hypothetical protein